MAQQIRNLLSHRRAPGRDANIGTYDAKANMSTANTPQSQKADVKPISFILIDPAASSAMTEIVLYVRPEELTRTDPSRTQVTQTLGGRMGR